MKKPSAFKIRQLEELNVCPFKNGICVDASDESTCKLLPICIESAKLKILKEILDTLKEIAKR